MTLATAEGCGGRDQSSWIRECPTRKRNDIGSYPAALSSQSQGGGGATWVPATPTLPVLAGVPERQTPIPEGTGLAGLSGTGSAAGYSDFVFSPNMVDQKLSERPRLKLQCVLLREPFQTRPQGRRKLSMLAQHRPSCLSPQIAPPPASPRDYFFTKLNHRLYLHENNHQTMKVLFSFLYNGFRGSRFTRVCRLRRHSRGAPNYRRADFLRPRLVSTLPFAAPRIFDNCIIDVAGGPGGDSHPPPRLRAV
jgi:hypothetical protein